MPHTSRLPWNLHRGEQHRREDDFQLLRRRGGLMLGTSVFVSLHPAPIRNRGRCGIVHRVSSQLVERKEAWGREREWVRQNRANIHRPIPDTTQIG